MGMLLGWHKTARGRALVDGHVLAGNALPALRAETALVDPAVQLWNRALLENLVHAGEQAQALAPVMAQAATLICITHVAGEAQIFDRVLVVQDRRIVKDAEPGTLTCRNSSRYRAFADGRHAGSAESVARHRVAPRARNRWGGERGTWNWLSLTGWIVETKTSEKREKRE